MYFPPSHTNSLVLLGEAHAAAEGAPFWDILQASERAAAFYGQLRRAGRSQELSERLAIAQFTAELLSGDELSGLRLSLGAYSQSRSMA